MTQRRRQLAPITASLATIAAAGCGGPSTRASVCDAYEQLGTQMQSPHPFSENVIFRKARELADEASAYKDSPAVQAEADGLGRIGNSNSTSPNDLLNASRAIAALCTHPIGVPTPPPPPPPPPRQTTFTDRRLGLSLRYPADWSRLSSRDPQVHLVAAASLETSITLRVAKSELADVSLRTLPVVRQFSDQLLAADQRAKMLSEPEPVSLAGIPGYRYRYTYTTGAHVHYFLFKHRQLVQLVFQSVPATGLSAAEPTYNAIAASLRTPGR